MNDLDFYLKRLNPILDLETGTMIDEIDRMQLEIDMLKVDKSQLTQIKKRGVEAVNMLHDMLAEGIKESNIRAVIRKLEWGK